MIPVRYREFLVRGVASSCAIETGEERGGDRQAPEEVHRRRMPPLKASAAVDQSAEERRASGRSNSGPAPARTAAEIFLRVDVLRARRIARKLDSEPAPPSSFASSRARRPLPSRNGWMSRSSVCVSASASGMSRWLVRSGSCTSPDKSPSNSFISRGHLRRRRKHEPCLADVDVAGTCQPRKRIDPAPFFFFFFFFILAL